MSQPSLGDCIGLTFQQVQKYERGKNRVSASMLYEMAKALNVSIAFFFEGFPDLKADGQNNGQDAFLALTTPANVKLLQAVSSMHADLRLPIEGLISAITRSRSW